MGGTHGTHGIPRYQISRYQYRGGHGIPWTSRYFTVLFRNAKLNEKHVYNKIISPFACL